MEPNVSQIGRLTTRQRECARLVAQGMTSKEIAQVLQISPSTVDNHINAALTSLGVSKRSYLSKIISDKNNITSCDHQLEFSDGDSINILNNNGDFLIKITRDIEAIANRHIGRIITYSVFILIIFTIILFFTVATTIHILNQFG